MNSIDPTKSERLPALDSLRGIAALIVVLAHCFMSWPESLHAQLPLWLSFTPFRLLLASHASVILFFVLSGYVLTIPFMRHEQPPYFSYLIKRICRIYLPFAAAIFLSALLFHFSHPAPADLCSHWLTDQWSHPFSSSTIPRHLMMTGEGNDMWLDGVMWSLIYELRISLLFPFLVLLGRRPHIALASSVVIYIAVWAGAVLIAIPNDRVPTGTIPESLFLTFRFVPFFIIGSTLALQNPAIKNWLLNLSKSIWLVLFIASLVMFTMPVEIYNQRLKTIFPLLAGGFLKFPIEFCFGIASAFIIVSVRNVPGLMNLLMARPARWLGKVSYSLYLIHLPIIIFMFGELLGKFSFALTALITIVFSLIAAEIFYQLVERPSMYLGRVFAKRGKAA